LLDNALDAAEEAGIAPKIEIEIGADRITVAANGPGIAAETVERLLDPTSRTSARAHYVSPTRGAQGQAVSTLLVMPYALSPGSEAAIIIESRGLVHHVNKLTGEPKLVREVGDGLVQSGARFTVEWPQSASTPPGSVRYGFVPLAISYLIANPHLALTLRTSEGENSYEASDPAWTKWRTCDPTSPTGITRRRSAG
jgi:DNA topoisomerase VI subunit B